MANLNETVLNLHIPPTPAHDSTMHFPLVNDDWAADGMEGQLLLLQKNNEGQLWMQTL